LTAARAASKSGFWVEDAAMTNSADSAASGPAAPGARARRHEEAGRFAEALADLDLARKLAPRNPEIPLAQARCLAALGRFAQSAGAARTALALAPQSAEAHHLLGFALEQLGDLGQARKAYEAAAARDPGMTDAVARLAGLAARRGDWPQARALAERALSRVPGHAAAQFALVMADMAEGRPAAAEARARRIADDPAFIPQVRATAMSFLADALDRQDRTAEAFAAYLQSNAALKALHRAQFEQQGAASGMAVAARLLGELQALQSTPWPAAEPAAARPHVFVLGFPRSGTTLIAEILAGHPGTSVMDERNLLGDALGQFTGRPEGLRALAAAGADELAHWRELYWERAARNGAGDGMIVDKSPFHSLHLPVIARLFPSARILFAVRDPRDVVFACFRRLFALNAFLYQFLSLEGTAAFYDSVMRLAEAYRAAIPLSLLEVRNEALIADPESELRRLCGFVGIEPNAAMIDFTRRKERRDIASPQSAGLASGLSGAGRGQWRRYAQHLAPVMPVLRPWVRRFGYED
jgi:Flp pilus assembly protein TadD